ncbi:MAG: nucleotidyltransferase family protein [Deltaproteobacteria bacterium]|nr:nucleotidyltransferase family protein [Deltaproteobacteria bacterium]
MEPIPGVVLGAGGSERFGSEKLLALLPTGERLLERALRVHLQSHISPLVLVVSPNLRKTIMGITDTFSSSGLKVGKRIHQWYCFSCRWGGGRLVTNENFEKGMSSSIHKGLTCLTDEEKACGVLISLADLPFLAPQTINFLINKFLEEKMGMLVPVFNGTTGHPVIVDIDRFKHEINHITGDVGLKDLMHKFPEAVKRLPWHNDSVTRDIDTSGDLERLEGDQTC